MRALVLVSVVASLGCAHAAAPGPKAKAFSGEEAMAALEAVLVLPRAPGDSRREDSIETLRTMMGAAGLEGISSIGHTTFDPWSERYIPLRNLIGWVRPEARRVFVLATHFDTPPHAHADPNPARREEPVAGANDGTSGVAVLLTLAPLLAAQLPKDVGFAVVLFDGEEVGRPGVEGGYCVGSRHMSQRMRRGELRELARAEFGVVLDMVGDADLSLPKDPSSKRFHPRLQEHVYAVAAQAGVAAFNGAPGPAVLDDHVYLTQGGVPSILLIDYDFAHWHATGDDLSAVSARSLETVGEVLRQALLAWF